MLGISVIFTQARNDKIMLEAVVKDVQFDVKHIRSFHQSFNMLNHSIKLIRNTYMWMKNELKLTFYLNYVNRKHKK